MEGLDKRQMAEWIQASARIGRLDEALPGDLSFMDEEPRGLPGDEERNVDCSVVAKIAVKKFAADWFGPDESKQAAGLASLKGPPSIFEATYWLKTLGTNLLARAKACGVIVGTAKHGLWFNMQNPAVDALFNGREPRARRIVGDPVRPPRASP